MIVSNSLLSCHARASARILAPDGPHKTLVTDSLRAIVSAVLWLMLWLIPSLPAIATCRHRLLAVPGPSLCTPVA
ncbi:hypothetical protein PLICRDRAFT_179698 [Plicaturopsis crispa FD-325 SS-3]|uniref:Uncharacterized protein n=1 Tax=Plicaturopsis crispa FD-325 SS-3 TaxID=944288 RepID=A0A0C9SKW9_PLICR|nr:hypothetical protein PLICRDRAFT_179698 [Plicaturopsis crispa FD-325 SS-3]